MILSKSCEYAIRASVYVAFKSTEGEKVGIIEIANAIDSPLHFTGKILQTLVRKKVLCSSKGPTGGFFIPAERTIKIIEIVYAIDGQALFTSCVMGLKSCSGKKPCPMHHQMEPIRDEILLKFQTQTLNEFVEAYRSNLYFLK